MAKVVILCPLDIRREGLAMLRHFDHLTVVVRDLDRAHAFFAVLGFKEAIAVVIAGPPFDTYMGVASGPTT